MNNNIVDRAIENSKIREKLHGAGIFPTLIVDWANGSSGKWACY